MNLSVNVDPIVEFSITLPGAFDLDAVPQKIFSYWDNRLTSGRYPLREDLLGKTFNAELLMVTAEGRMDDDLIASAKESGYTLPGVMGAVLLPKQCGQYLRRVTRWEVPVMCLEDKDFLYKKEGAHRVPYFNLHEGSYSLHVAKMKSKLFVGTYLVLFK